LLILLATQALVSTPANASASGCTWAPGYAGARNCIYVSGTGLYVLYTESSYTAGVAPWPNQLCNREHEWLFHRQGASQPSTAWRYHSGCIPGLAGFTSSYGWYHSDYMKDNTSYCARTRNSHTLLAGPEWSPYACISIHA